MADKQLETWKNITRARYFIKQVNRFGDIVSVQVPAGKTFHISPEDRRINQEIAASDELDVFKNGVFSPVRLIETEEDAQEIASNPNLIGESDMRELFKGKKNWRAFDATVAAINNEMTLGRLLEVAREEDATVRQVEAIEARISELTGNGATEANEVEQIRPENPGFKPVTPN